MLQAPAWADTTTSGPSGLSTGTKPPIVYDCYYAGQRYSDGSVITVGDKQLECDRDRWIAKK